MFVCIDSSECVFVIFDDLDDVRKYVNSLRLEVDTTSPRDLEYRGYTYNCFESESWIEDVKRFFDIQIKEVVPGKEIFW